jgi:2,5-dioxopentanoate dehydrogenase
MITGSNLVGGNCRNGTGTVIRGVAAKTGHPLEPDFFELSHEDLGRACDLADAAAHPFRQTSWVQRTGFLERIAADILAIGDELVLRCAAETGLPTTRLLPSLKDKAGRLFVNGIGKALGDASEMASRTVVTIDDKTDDPRPDSLPRKAPGSYGEHVDWIQCGAK